MALGLFFSPVISTLLQSLNSPPQNKYSRCLCSNAFTDILGSFQSPNGMLTSYMYYLNKKLILAKHS